MARFGFYFIFYLPFIFCSSKKIRFHTTSVKCEHDPVLYNGTTNCFIKPYRNGTQLSTIEYNFQKPCHELWLHEQFFFKFGGSGKYRQWMINNDENLCGFYDGTATPGIFMGLTKKALERVSPKTMHACPYTGVEGISNLDIDDIVANKIPQVIPTGDYRFVLRFHTITNNTFLVVTIGGHIDAVNPLEAMAMGRK